MNKLRRMEIYNIIDQLNRILNMLKNKQECDIESLIMDIIDLIQSVFDEEESAMENIPENLQGGYRYQQSEEACDNLYDAIYTLEGAIEDEDEDVDWDMIINDAIKSLNSAT